VFEDEHVIRSIRLTRAGYQASGVKPYSDAQGSSPAITYLHGNENRSFMQSPNKPYLFRVFSVISMLANNGDKRCMQVAVEMLNFLSSAMGNQLTLFKEGN